MNYFLKIIPLFLVGFVFSQTYVVFEKTAKNKELYDYSDPNSLVSVLMENKHLFDRNPDCAVDEMAIHPTDGMFTSSLLGSSWEIYQPNSLNTVILTREFENETFEQWFERLTTRGDSTFFDPVDYEQLKFEPIEELRTAYNKAKQYLPLRRKPVSYFYDLREIDLIFMDSVTVYFAKKSPYDSKHFISFKISKESLLTLSRESNWANSFAHFEKRLLVSDNDKQNILNKLQEFQRTNMELDKFSPDNNYNNVWESDFNMNLFTNVADYADPTFFLYRNGKKLVSKTFQGENWSILGWDSNEEYLLTKEYENETFDDWYNRLTTVGDSINFNPEEYGALTLQFKDILKKQYDLTAVGNPIKRPDFESVYWVDYPNPDVYVNCQYVQDSVGKGFRLIPYQIIITERLDNKKGGNSKPLVLMAFGHEDYTFPKEIEGLLQQELKPFFLKKQFAWMDRIQKGKGKKIDADALKQMIHAYEINSKGINY